MPQSPDGELGKVSEGCRSHVRNLAALCCPSSRVDGRTRAHFIVRYIAPTGPQCLLTPPRGPLKVPQPGPSTCARTTGSAPIS